MNAKAILFDIDGVVVNSEMFSLQYQKESGITNEEMLPFYEGIFQECLKGKKDLKEVIIPWLKKWGWAGNVEDFIFRWFQHEHNINTQMARLIAELRERGFKCYAATNQEKYRTRYMREEMNFDQIFNGIFSSCEIGSIKPEIQYYEYIIQNLGINKKDIIFIDNSPSHIEGAKTAGLNTFLFDDFKSLYEYLNLKSNG